MRPGFLTANLWNGLYVSKKKKKKKILEVNFVNVIFISLLNE